MNPTSPFACSARTHGRYALCAGISFTPALRRISHHSSFSFAFRSVLVMIVSGYPNSFEA